MSEPAEVRLQLGGEELCLRVAAREDEGMLFDEPDSDDDSGAQPFDHTGLFYIWPAARLLAEVLVERRPELVRGLRVLELGAGAGLVGLAAARAGAARVLLTDGDEAALANAEANARSQGEAADVAAQLLPWDAASVAALAAAGEQFDVVLAADVVYPMKDRAPLMEALAAVREAWPAARVVLSYTARDQDTSAALASDLARWWGPPHELLAEEARPDPLASSSSEAEGRGERMVRVWSWSPPSPSS